MKNPDSHAVLAGDIGGKLVATPFEQCIRRSKPIDKQMLKIAAILAT